MTDPVDPALADFAHRLADAARPIARRYFRQPVEIISKSDDSPVTIADREIEAAMRALIEAEYPDHGIFGEEHGAVRTDAEHVWVLDPIDGTRSFITGMPVFGTLIALARRGRPVLGVLDQPILEERWTGAVGHPATYQKGPSAPQPTRTAGSERVADAALYLTSPDQLTTDARRAAFEALTRQVRDRRFGGDCYVTGLLASGFVQLHVECDMAPYDYMALAPIIEAAGGAASTWDGKPLTLTSGDTFLGAATPALRDAAVAILGPSV
ncbi:MAG: histidinol-phosphatase [Alphaproteobacteria bacterium]|nr:histidinol-phosphatase [Alphaproteobacteria bacterium]